MIEDTQTRYNMLCMRMRARAETVCGNFPRPLATEEHFRAAEERLGFHLPPILHQRYTTVSNGLDFFMPGYWFRGIADNWYASRPNWYTVEDEVWHGIRLDEATHNALEAHPGAFIVLDHPPEDALYLATLGGHEHVGWMGLLGSYGESANTMTRTMNLEDQNTISGRIRSRIGWSVNLLFLLGTDSLTPIILVTFWPRRC